jgi:hypothetical protein
MRLSTKWLAMVTMAAVLGTGAATAAAQDGKGNAEGKGRHGQRQGGRRGQHARGGQGMRQRGMHARKAQMRRAVAQALALTPEQQRAALEKARAAQPIVAEARKERAKLLAQAQAAATTDTKGADRTAQRAAMKDLRTRTAEKLAPLAKDLVATLTPEQRAKLEGIAAARGRKFDEAKFVRRVSHWLARPMTADMLEAKLGTR